MTWHKGSGTVAIHGANSPSQPYERLVRADNDSRAAEKRPLLARAESTEPPFAISAISALHAPTPSLWPLSPLAATGLAPFSRLCARHVTLLRRVLWGAPPVLKCETETWERSIDRAKAHRTLVQTVRASWVPHATKVRPSRSDAPHCYLSWAPPARKILSSGDRSFLLSASC